MKRLLKILFISFLIPFSANAQIFSQYIETETGNEPKVLELYNNSGSIIYMGNDNVRIYYAANAGNESLATSIQTGQWKPGQVLVVGTKSNRSQSNPADETLGTIGSQIQALITERKEIPDNSLVMGSPGKIIRQITEDEIEAVKQNAIRYQENWKKYSKTVF